MNVERTADERLPVPAWTERASRDDLLDYIGDLLHHVEALERGEFICNKCGIRKDAEPEEGDDDIDF